MIHPRIENLKSAIDFIQSLDQLDTPQHSSEYHFTQGIARARYLLERLGGAPHATTQCVLVAGSKGKGSTTAMLASILASVGQRVGAFTGPHLHTPLERYSLSHLSADAQEEGAGVRASLMPPRVFVDFVRRIRDIVEAWDRDDLGPPTRFEAFTAMAYRWFEEKAVDIAVMEIGIGGRLDAVNLAEPMLSVITNISLEHTQILGDTLGQIAREKAGIMRAGKPVVIAQQANEAMDALCAEVVRVGALPVLAESEWHCEFVRHEIEPHRSGQWFVSPERHGDTSFFLPLLGAYQLQNAASVLAACDMLNRAGTGVVVDGRAVRAGFAATQWRGRFDLLGFDPIVIADGAHTPYSMEQLCASLRDYFYGQRIHFIVGILRDKDSRGMLEAISDTAASITLCDMAARRATPADQLLATWNELPQSRITIKPVLATRLHEALPQVLAHAQPDDVICITGSLHLVAEAEQIVTDVTQDLSQRVLRTPS